MRLRRIAPVLIILLSLLCGCNKTLINGTWKNRDIFIDGADTEWRGAKFLLDRQYFTVGAINDSDSLYVRISTADAIHQYRTLSFGMIVRLTPRKKDADPLEIHFPMGSNDLHMSRNDKAFDKSLRVREKRFHDLESSQTDSIGVVLSDSLRVFSYEAAKQKGITAVSGLDTRSLVTELSIPLGRNTGDSFGLEAEPGDIVDLLILLPAPDKDTVRKLLYERYGTTPNAFNSGVRKRSDRMIDEHRIEIELHLADK